MLQSHVSKGNYVLQNSDESKHEILRNLRNENYYNLGVTKSCQQGEFGVTKSK